MSSPAAAYPPVYREIPFLSPFEAYERLRGTNTILLESGKGPERIARYSFIGVDPYLSFRAKDGAVEIETAGRRTISSRNPLARLRELVSGYRQQKAEHLPPFQGGAAGMLSYDFVHYIERVPSRAYDDLKVPDAHFFMFDRIVAFDHAEERAWIVVCPGARQTVLGYTEVDYESGGPVKEAELVCDELSAKVLSPVISPRAGRQGNIAAGFRISHDITKDRYMEMVSRAKEYIAAGDIFQANLSLRVSAEIGATAPLDIYRLLRSINPSPFAAFADFGDYQIVSSSPERLVRVIDGRLDTRPIAGTRPRGRDTAEDREMTAELLLNEKERAEHIMLIDLERNDLGRVSDYGSVRVDELMATEEYSHVIHIVSNVRGKLGPGKDCFDAIRAAFPGGTITGVPKVRCMEIIDELEPTRRGPYTGSLGYIGFNGDMDLNIIIRTMLVKDGRAYIQAGAGIVADSDPEREYYESLKKAEALIRTLEML
jgi:anthranilate/para-aminobenzoate synthase component I